MGKQAGAELRAMSSSGKVMIAEQIWERWLVNFQSEIETQLCQFQAKTTFLVGWCGLGWVGGWLE
jgi:hypothetical protein